MVTLNASLRSDDVFAALLERAADEAVGRAGVVLFSDDEIFRAGCALALRGSERLTVAHAAGLATWRTVMGAMRLEPRDVVVVEAPSFSGPAAELVATVREAWPEAALVVIAGQIEPSAMRAIRELAPHPGGGVAALTRATIRSAIDLVRTVEDVRGGRVVLAPLMLGQLVDGGAEPQGTFGTRLSPREREVLGLMACGLTNGGTATRLCLELKTVERHINGIYTKLPEHTGEGHPRVSVVVAYLMTQAQAA
jgi:DNA-binding NarL/FixJ family response regulator